tara:strand:+ start:82 stop:765 length:684 start_codon:yes stop_codon:yes gene_type:complete
MKIKAIFLSLLLISCGNNSNDEFSLQIGDILFQDLDSSPLCDAIEKVTPGYNDYNFSHIGIVVELGDPNCINSDYIYENDIKILEAIPEKVKTTRLDSFLNRSFDSDSMPKVVVGRLKKQYHFLIDDAVSFLKSKIGVEYDHYFIEKNNQYYCSELIHEAFSKDSIFFQKPMTFIEPKTGKIMDTWDEYYKNLDFEVPEGKTGINPGIMSISQNIEIIHHYGVPSKK